MKKYLWLFVILTIGVWLRFDRLTTIPPSLSHDEVAIAYNAYSILKTGKDEYGMSFPVLFRSFDDYKLPGMVYTTIPFVAIFGRSELTARLPSALFGTLAICIMYLLSIELLGENRRIKIGKYKFDAALLPAFMLAIQPWHINFSRQLFESNGATFWFTLGTYFLLRSRNNFNNILWAGLSYVLSLYFYYSVRLVIPFVLLLYVFYEWRALLKNWRFFALSIAVCLIVFIPLGREMFSPGGLARINTVSVANDQNFIDLRGKYTNIIAAHPTTVNKIIYNRRVALAETIAANYWKNIDPHNLFITGTGTYGALYSFEGVLLILGLVRLFSLPRYTLLVTLTWLVTGFLPGAFSLNQPNTLRTLVVAPAFALLSGFGLSFCMIFAKKWKYGIAAFFAILIAILLINFPAFHYAYFVNNPTNNALAFGDGYKQMVTYVKANESKYDRIYISGYYWRPYIFLLYWGGINPADYQNGGNREHFGKYYFTSASWDTNGIKMMDKSFDPATVPADKNTLFILSNAEYLLHGNKFTKLQDINGRFAQKVFVAAVRI